MTFEIENFKEVGGRGNSTGGGQLYSIFSETDNLSDMQVDGYLNEKSNVLNKRDFIFLSATDGSLMVQVASNISGVVKVVDFIGGFESVKFEGIQFADLKTSITLVETESQALELKVADGLFEGQRKIFVVMVDGGADFFLNPVNFADGISITFQDPKDFCEILWTSALGWKIIINDGGSVNV